MTELIIMLDKQIIKRLAIKGTNVTIGRHSGCDISLPDRTISVHHARITAVREDCFLEDQNSTNGTYVNHYLVDRHLLMDGDTVGLGKYQIVFRSNEGLEAQLKRLSIHPKLLDSHDITCLRVIEGRKAGFIIPLNKGRVVLGNNEIGRILIERSARGEYIMKESGMSASGIARTLLPGEELKVEDVTFQFCPHLQDVIDPA